MFQNDNVRVSGKIVYLPMYMLMFLHKEPDTTPQIYKLDLEALK